MVTNQNWSCTTNRHLLQETMRCWFGFTLPPLTFVTKRYWMANMAGQPRKMVSLYQTVLERSFLLETM
ncbi:hypothetical protein BJB45_21720 [Halomonas huangheensis]|uniref:Uncharacterized protein n=1 Tax=Halomonas huangheensis TaxID=1178482 RepID=W1N1C5_9GAMM|nr:hypothetical protein BJB45_21720 [Halomonas huangheensis]